MKPGPVPRPSKLVALRGGTDLTHRPENKEEPKPPEKMPPCPPYLDDAAKTEWKRISGVLFPLGLLTEADMMILAAYCDSYSRWSRAVQKVTEKGDLIKVAALTPARKGEKSKTKEIKNPYSTIRDAAQEQMLRAGSRLGLSPSDRSGMKVSLKPPKSKLESFMGRKHGQKD